jgi:hypothetical protein
MGRSFFLSGVTLLALAGAADAGDPPSPYACPCTESWLDRFVQRTPRPCWPAANTMQRAGYPQQISKCAAPSLSCRDYGGYVGGAKPCLNPRNLMARGPMSGNGPQYYGTYGTDYGGLRGHLARVFLAPSEDPSRGYPIAWNYRAEGPRVTDVFAARPLRKAILEQHEEKEHRHGYEAEGHGPAHTAGEAGHAPEGGH